MDKKLRIRVTWCVFHKDIHLANGESLQSKHFELKTWHLSLYHAKWNNIPFSHINRYFRKKKGQENPDTWLKFFNSLFVWKTRKKSLTWMESSSQKERLMNGWVGSTEKQASAALSVGNEALCRVCLAYSPIRGLFVHSWVQQYWVVNESWKLKKKAI